MHIVAHEGQKHMSNVLRYLIGPNMGGRKYGRPKFRAALIMGAKGPSAHIRAAHTFQNNFFHEFYNLQIEF